MQASAPCTWAPILWIDPLASLQAIEPSARMRAAMRLVGSNSVSPALTSPRSISVPKGMRGSARLLVVTFRASSRQLFRGVDAGQRGLGIFFFTLDADEDAAQLLGRRTRGAGAEERIEHHVAGIGGRQEYAMQESLRLLCGVKLVAESFFSRSAPVQSEMVQSERICRSSLNTFIAS